MVKLDKLITDDKIRQKSFWQIVIIRFNSNKLARFSLFFIVILASLTVIIPLVSSYDYSMPDFVNSLEPPSIKHWFGTDGLGRDLFVRTFIGGRITFEIAFMATIAVMCIGIIYGAIAGFVGGIVDTLMMRFVDILYGIPFLFFSILLITLFGQSLFVSFVAIAAISWLDMARVVRGQTIGLRHKEFIEAAILYNLPRWAIIINHIIPNLLGVVIVYLALVVPNMIVLSAVLSFFGLGVMEPMTSWGVLISDGANNMTAWWLLLFPSLMMITTLLAFANIANGLRDALDPR